MRESREITRNRHVQGVRFMHVFRRVCVNLGNKAVRLQQSVCLE